MRPRIQGKRLAVVLGLLAVAACGGHNAQTAHAALHAELPKTHRAVTTTSTTIGYHDRVAPPPLIETGTDYAAILTSQLEYANWIAEHDVDTSHIANVAAPGSPWETALRADVRELQHHHAHFDERYDGPAHIALVSVLPDVVSARYTQHLTRQAWIDARGNTTNVTIPTAPTTSYIVVMARVGPAGWRLVSLDRR